MILIDDVKQQFGNVSKKYDSQRKYLIPCFDDFYRAGLPLIKSVANAKTVLDIGVGTGLFSQFVYEQNPHLHFTLADISDPMLSVARTRFRGRDNFDFIELDLATDKIPGKFDIHHVGLGHTSP